MKEDDVGVNANGTDSVLDVKREDVGVVGMAEVGA